MSNKFNVKSISLESISKFLAMASGLDYSSGGNKTSFSDESFSNSPSSNLNEYFVSSSKGAVSLSKYLSYRYYDEESNMFFDDEANAGFLIELSPIVGSDIALIKNLNYFFNNEMPDNSFMQFLLLASNDINHITHDWQKSRISNSLPLKMLGVKREIFLKNLASNFKEAGGRNVRDYRLYLVFTSKTNQSLSDITKNFTNKPTSDQRSNITSSEILKLKNFSKALMQKLDSINLAPKLLAANDLIKLVREILELDLSLNQDAKATFPKRSTKYDSGRILADQILTPLTYYEVGEDRVINHTSNIATKSYYVSELPETFSLDQMINLTGDSSRDNLSIPARFLISYIIASSISQRKQVSLIQKGEKIIENSEQWYARNNRDIKREALEWKDINDKARNGEKFISEYLSITISAYTDFIDEAESSLLSLYNIHNWKLDLNRYLQMPALLSVLPFQAPLTWNLLSEFKLTRIALSSEVAAKLPIHAEWKGVPEAGMLLIGRRGQLFNFNPFYRISSGNYNICVFGPSGSGKSVFLQELATNMLAQDAKIFILDIGQSFKNICKLLGGEIIQFGSKSNIVLNPFAGFKESLEKEDRNIAITYAKAIICSMTGALNSPVKEASNRSRT
ncbi:MAG: TraC family protein [Rickettsiaceae bacterium]|nr:TraC family protein [Rickettsiaceae bacterium]